MRSGFFNSEIIGYDAENMPIFDRAEEASFFAKYFSQFISNGVFPNPSTNLQVLANTDMTVKVDIGVCYINGYMGWVETTAEILEIEESDTQSRIDRIVARLDFEDRSIKLFVKKGTAAGNPVAPEVQRDYDIYEIALADIRVNANVIEITQANITDLRLNTELCGIVANQLQHVDTTTLFNQYQDWLTRTIGQAEIDLAAIKADLETYVENAKTNFDEWVRIFENQKSEEFNSWFQTIKDILDSDTAGHLYNLIVANTDLINAKTKELQDTKADKKKTWNITLDTTWTGTEAPYTKTVSVNGILSTDIVNMYPVYSNTLETRQTEKEEYNKISMLTSTTNSITLTCDEEKPETALNVRLEVLY